MLAINHQPAHTKSFYYFGAALIAAMVILMAIRLHPSIDLGLFKPSDQDKPGTISKKNPDSHKPGSDSGQASAQPESSSSTLPENSFGISNGSNSGNTGAASPQQSGASRSTGPTPTATYNNPVTSQPATIGSTPAGSGGSSPVASGEPDGDEVPAINLPSVNVSPTVDLGLPKL